jgi:hypothetical protein
MLDRNLETVPLDTAQNTNAKFPLTDTYVAEAQA